MQAWSLTTECEQHSDVASVSATLSASSEASEISSAWSSFDERRLKLFSISGTEVVDDLDLVLCCCLVILMLSLDEGLPAVNRIL